MEFDFEFVKKAAGISQPEKKTQENFPGEQHMLETITRLSSEKTALLIAAKYVLAELDNVYDVDEESGTGHKREYPFAGAGECMRRLQYAIERCEDGE